MSTLHELRAAVASGRFTGNEGALLAAALETSEPWSGSALLRRLPERSRAAFYRALKALRARSVIATRGGPGKWKGKWEINRAIDEWKNRAGDGLLFSENSPESLGYSRRLTDNKPATETPRRPRKLPRVKPTREENRVDDDENGDQPGQRHITDPAGTDLNQKEPDIWDKAIARLKAAHRDP